MATSCFLSILPVCVLCCAVCQVPVPGAIASLQMTPQGVVHSFYPLKGNEAAMNHNLLKGLEHWMGYTQHSTQGQLHCAGAPTSS